MSLKDISSNNLLCGEDGADAVNLSFRSLTQLPDRLWESTQLQKLVLAGNPLTILPRNLSRLTNLQNLNCGSCELTTFPIPSIPYLQNLTNLNLSGNKIVEIPDNIGKLTNLVEMLLGTNLISQVPGSLGDLENLTVLKLGKCKLQEFPAAIARLKNLKELQLSENSISGPVPSYLFRLPNLENLDLSYNKFDSLLDGELEKCSGEELDEFFAPMAKLSILTMNDNFFKTIPPHTLSNFPSLSVLQISFNKIETLPADLGKATSLVMIDIASNRVKEIHTEWESLLNLSSLDIAYNDLKSIPDSFINLQSLRVFTAIGNDMETMPSVCQGLIDRGVRVRFNDAEFLPNCIIPGLFLGGVSAARDKYGLKRLGIDHVLTVAEIDPLYDGEFVYKTVRIDDHADQNISAFFEECRLFIAEGIQSGGVLVHCAAGVSRSATIVIMYVMSSQHKTFDEAFDIVRDKRPIICPNSGFRDQLRLYEQELLKKDGFLKSEKCIVS